jgi:hypothetical protein
MLLLALSVMTLERIVQAEHIFILAVHQWITLLMLQ